MSVAGQQTVVGPGPAPPSLSDTDTGGRIVRAGHKRYFFDLGSNQKGAFLRITEVRRPCCHAGVQCIASQYCQICGRATCMRHMRVPSGCPPTNAVLRAPRPLAGALMPVPAALATDAARARQVVGTDRISIIVPAEALPQFQRAITQCLEQQRARRRSQRRARAPPDAARRRPGSAGAQPGGGMTAAGGRALAARAPGAPEQAARVWPCRRRGCAAAASGAARLREPARRRRASVGAAGRAQGERRVRGRGCMLRNAPKAARAGRP